jgi:hypothetical protein
MDHCLDRDERYWRDRAEEMRVLALTARSPHDQSVFLRIAASYLRVSQRARSLATQLARAAETADPGATTP